MTGILLYGGLWLAAAVVGCCINHALCCAARRADDCVEGAFDEHVAQAIALTHDARCECAPCLDVLYGLPSPITEHKP